MLLLLRVLLLLLLLLLGGLCSDMDTSVCRTSISEEHCAESSARGNSLTLHPFLPFPYGILWQAFCAEPGTATTSGLALTDKG